jgi:hypothetical protein
MSKISTEAKLNIQSKRFGRKCRASKPVDRSYSNFAGSNVPPLTKEQWDKAMALSHKYKNMSAW